MRLGRRAVLAGLLGGAGMATARAGWAFGTEVGKIVLALPPGDPALWEIAAMRAEGLDKYHNIEIELHEVADAAEGLAAVEGRKADMTISDMLAVSARRQAGKDVTLAAWSLASCGLVAPAGGAVAGLADLAGRRLVLAGGPQEGAAALLQAAFHAATGQDLAQAATLSHAPPAEAARILAEGQADAGLLAWPEAARALLAGAARIAAAPDLLTALGLPQPPPFQGWAFTEKTARKKKDQIRHFLDAALATRQKLLSDEAAWQAIRPALPAEADEALVQALRAAWRDTVPARPEAPDIEAARAAHAAIARHAGTAATGGAEDLDEGSFWSGWGQS